MRNSPIAIAIAMHTEGANPNSVQGASASAIPMHRRDRDSARNSAIPHPHAARKLPIPEIKKSAQSMETSATRNLRSRKEEERNQGINVSRYQGRKTLLA
jgi:hypothetical protein